MINDPNPNHEEIDRQTVIVRKLRSIVTAERSSVEERSNHLYPRTKERAAKSFANNSRETDNESRLDIEANEIDEIHEVASKVRSINTTGGDEAIYAAPVAWPRQLPKIHRTNKALGVKEVAELAIVHPTFDQQHTNKYNRHTRVNNTTNRSLINQRKVPPPKSLKDRIRMPPPKLSEYNLTRHDNIEDDNESDLN